MPHRPSIISFLTFLILMVTMIPQYTADAENRSPSHQAFTDDFDSFDIYLWHKADGWANGDPFACGWLAGHISISGGVMTLQLDDVGLPGRLQRCGLCLWRIPLERLLSIRYLHCGDESSRFRGRCQQFLHLHRAC